MSDIDELGRMLESRSTDYGRMRQLLASHRLGLDRARERGLSVVPLVKIIEHLAAGDRASAVLYAEHLVHSAEERYERTKDVLDRCDIMTARNVLHVINGEPKEGGIAVLDGTKGTGNGK